ncbi:hypothetical protein WICPIJ_008565 [Wickerhamomyces pijperi]|uniref:Protein kinase domain-containing protein n=1 Tax=Wickerhamomyces pijperi TaxID=599730 RepID=A0A9P8PWE7_WICPI|nr:hypothetical protein WICPIJ_008565 [Wickerhamomyces pijperi]
MSTQTTSGPALSMIPLQRVKCHTTVEIDTASTDPSIHRSHVGRHSGSESSEDEENIFLGEEFVPYDPSCDITHRDSVSDCYTIQRTLGSGGYGSVSVVATKPGHNFLRDIKKFKKPVDSLLEFGKSWRYENKFSFKGIYAMKEQAVSAVPGGDVFRCPELADYGLAMNVNQDIRKYGHGGTLPYMAPDNVFRLGNIGKPVDIWAVGLVAFDLLTGKIMFKNPANGDDLLFQMVKRLGRPFVTKADKAKKNQDELNSDSDSSEPADAFERPCFGY